MVTTGAQALFGDGTRLLTVAEVASAMRVSTMTVYRLIKSGDLPAVRVGQNYRVRERGRRALSGRPDRSRWRDRDGEGPDRSGHRLHGRARRGARSATPLTVVRASQVPCRPGPWRAARSGIRARSSEALKKLWSEGGFKGRQVWLGVGNQRVVVREIALPVPAREGAARLARLPGAGVHPDAGRRRGPRLRPDRGVRAGGPPDAPDAPRRGPARHGRSGRAGRDRRASSSRWGSTWSRSRWSRSVGATDGGMDLEEGVARRPIVDVGAHVTNIVRPRARRHPVRPDPAERVGAMSPSRSRARLGVEDDIAERLKRGEAVEDAPEPAGRSPGRDAARRRASSTRSDPRSSSTRRRRKDARIGKVLVTGGGSRLEGFFDLMRQRIPVPVEPGARLQPRPASAATRPTSPLRSRSLPSRSASPCRRRSDESRQSAPHRHQEGPGGSSPDAARVDRRRRRDRPDHLLLGAPGRATQRCERRHRGAEPDERRLQQEIDDLQKYEDLQVEAQQQEQLLEAAYADEVAYSSVLLDVSKVIPPDTYLTSSASTVDTTAVPPTDPTAPTFVGTMTFAGRPCTSIR